MNQRISISNLLEAGWSAYIDGHYIGVFDSKAEAIDAAEDALADKYMSEFQGNI